MPSRIVGHPPESVQPLSNWPNLVEGREMWSPEGIALDTSVTPPILYVADTGNNRVLAWKNALTFRNGQPADLVIGQSGSPYTTGAQGPGTTFSSGFNTPTGLLVDSNGNLLVADSNNNRILRFPKPFAQQNGQFPDLYIGQPNANSKTANFTGAVSDQGLSLASAPVPTNMAFDSDKNLWVVDAGNRRVLRFKSTDVASGGGPLTANLVLGQQDFVTAQPAVTSATRTTNNAFAIPHGISFDPAGRLYISDMSPDRSVGRVLVFKAPFTSGQSAVKIMGVFPTTAPSQDAIDKTTMLAPTGMFFISGASPKMGVLDTFSSRILLFDAAENWLDAATPFSPLATGVVGQPDFHNRGGNKSTGSWIGAPSSSSLYAPIAATFFNNELYVADTSNNRIVVLPLTGNAFFPAARVLGQDLFTTSGINLVEGREFAFLALGSSGVNLDAGVAIDETTDTPHLYVADSYNHRILGFRDFRKVKAGGPFDKADIVIGQPDFKSNLCNVTGNPDALSPSSLCFPTGLLVDANGDLYVADTGNGRVLRFPAPFAKPALLPPADLVLGQRNFISKITDPSASTMSQPYGLAIAGPNGLLVSDLRHNRVLLFAFNSNGTMQAGTDNGKPAIKVFGQPDFTTVSAGNSASAMNGPHHIAADNEARLYVADTGNNRVMIFDQVGNPDSSSFATYLLTGLSQPRGVFVNQATSEIWVAEGGASTVRRFPIYRELVNNPVPNYTVQAGSNALAVVQDQYGDLIVADGSSRLGFYFPGLQALNGGNFLPSRNYLAPGLLTSLCSPGSNCSGGSAIFGPNTVFIGTDLPNPFPMPRTLGDVQVLFNDEAAPLYYVSPTQINFVVPMNAPTTGLADMQVVQVSTGRVLAAGRVAMNTASPAILMTTAYSGRFRQAAVINQDGTVNGPEHPAARGSYISIYATGQGFVKGGPADGELVTGDYRTDFLPQINIAGQYLDNFTAISDDIPKAQWLYSSGLSPYPGLWQINMWVPKGVQANNQVPLLLLFKNQLSTDANSTSIITTIAVK